MFDIKTDKQNLSDDTEKETNEFHDFLEDLKMVVKKFGFGFNSAEPDFEHQRVSLHFAYQHEEIIDALIKHIRANLAADSPENDKFSNSAAYYSRNQYPIGVWKSYVISTGCWSVDFFFADQWTYTENILI